MTVREGMGVGATSAIIQDLKALSDNNVKSPSSQWWNRGHRHLTRDAVQRQQLQTCGMHAGLHEIRSSKSVDISDRVFQWRSEQEIYRR